ncbi:MAG: group II intron reverse transcriptase/maturase, partial [Clostridium sp.]|nr:group II intron reverse transcriptase/maturase [Clostridium sp.]
KMITNFLHRVQKFLCKTLNRRSDKKSYCWDGYTEMLKYYPLAKPKIYFKLF